jgi:hypothetical protein
MDAGGDARRLDVDDDRCRADHKLRWLLRSLFFRQLR